MSGTTIPAIAVTAPPGTEFQLRYRVHGTTEWSDYGPRTTELHETMVDLTPGETYDVEVLSITPSGIVSSEIVTFTMTLPAGPPAPPGKPVVSNITATSAVVNWPRSGTDTGDHLYRVYLAPHGGGFVPYGTADRTASITLTGLTPLTSYDVQVTATNSVATSFPSPVTPFTTVDVGPPPSTTWQGAMAVRGVGGVTVQQGARQLPAVVNVVGQGRVTAGTVSLAESPQGTTVNDTTGIIYDGSLNSWTLLTSPSSGLQVARNGTRDTSTSNVVLLLYWGHQVYQNNSAGNWYVWSGTAWTAVAGDPRNAESPDGTVVTDTIGKIIDATGAVWTLVPQQVAGYPGGRDPVLQPFLSSDFWNVGIGSGAQWTTTTDAATAKLITLAGGINTDAVPAPIAPPIGVGVFSVQGGNVIMPDGVTVWKGKGVNIAADAAGWPFLKLSDTIINLSNGYNFRRAFPKGNYIRVACYSTGVTPQSIATYINALTALGIVCNIEYHLTGMNMPTNGAISNFYSSMANYFKGNTYVWFGFTNETGYWSGGSNDLRTAFNNWYNAVRNTGASNIVQFMCFAGFYPNYLNQNDFSDKTGMIGDMHHYPGEGGHGPYSSYQDNINGINAKRSEFRSVTTRDGLMPVVMSEGGDSNNGHDIDANWQNGIQAIIDCVNNGTLAGYTFWYWNGYDGDGDRIFASPYDGSSFTSYGQMIHNDTV